MACGQLWVPLAFSKATGRKEGGGAGLGKLINLWMERKGWTGQPGLGPGGSKGQVLSTCLEKEMIVESGQKGKADSSKVNGKASSDCTSFHKNFTAFHKDFSSMLTSMAIKSQVYCSFWWIFKLIQFIAFIVLIKLKPIKRRHFGEKILKI